jgi:hypothetical protein
VEVPQSPANHFPALVEIPLLPRESSPKHLATHDKKKKKKVNIQVVVDKEESYIS